MRPRQGDWRLRLFILMVLMLLLLAYYEASGATAVPPVHLNLKSAWLRNSLGSGGGSGETKSSTTTPLMTDGGDDNDDRRHIKLDLSGEYHLLLLAETKEDDDERVALRPLLRVGRTQAKWPLLPSLFVTVPYDFMKAWFGATRVVANAQWSRKHGTFMDGSTRNSRIRPKTVTFRAEQGLLSENHNQRAVQLDVAWDGVETTSDPPSPGLSVRLDNHGLKRVSAAAPLHRRLDLVLKSTWARSMHKTARAYDYASRWSSVPTLQDDDWWMPDIKVNTAGRLFAKNELGFSARERFVGVSLVVTRQLGWNAFGIVPSSDDDDQQETRVRLAVSGMNRKGTTYATLSMDTALERILDSTRWTVTHEHIHSIQ